MPYSPNLIEAGYSVDIVIAPSKLKKSSEAVEFLRSLWESEAKPIVVRLDDVAGLAVFDTQGRHIVDEQLCDWTEAELRELGALAVKSATVRSWRSGHVNNFKVGPQLTADEWLLKQREIREAFEMSFKGLSQLDKLAPEYLSDLNGLGKRLETLSSQLLPVAVSFHP